MTAPPAQLSGWRLAAFAAPCLPLAAIGLPLVVYLPEYYSNTLGLPVAAVGAAFLSVRLVDIGFDPLFGLALDRTPSRLGRYKPWLWLAVALLVAASVLLFFARPGVSAVHLWCGLLIAYGAFSIGVLAQTAWGASLSADYQGRSRVYAVWQGVNVVGLLLAMIAPTLAGKLTGRTDAAIGMQAMGLLIVVLAPLAVLVATLVAPEPRRAVQRHANWRDWVVLLTRPNVLRVFGSDVLMNFSTGIQGGLFFFYFERAKAVSRGQAQVMIIIYFLAAVLGAVVWTPLARRFGKAGGVIAAGLAVVAAQIVLWLTPSGNFPLLALATALSGLPYSASPFLLRAAMADIGDEEKLRHGQDHTGLLYALAASGAKIGSALTGGILVILGLVGFSGDDPGASSAAGETALRAAYLIGPAVLALLAAAVMIGYPLNAARHAEIRRALDAQPI